MNDLIQPLDIAGSYGRGRVSYEIGQEAERRNALQAFMADNGQALMAGDQNALSGLMQFDPQMALGLQRQGQQDALQREQMDLSRQQAQHGMANDSARLELARAEGKRQAEAFAVQLDDRKRAELAAKAKKASETALVAYKRAQAENNPAIWDKWNDANPEFEDVSFEDAPYKISEALGALEALMPKETETMTPYQQAQIEIENRRLETGNRGTYGLNPIRATDAEGNPVLLQPKSSGGADPIALPDGVTPTFGVDKIDAGDHWIMVDKQTGNVVGTQPKNVRNEASEAAIGKAEGEIVGGAKAQLPAARLALDEVTAKVDEIVTSPILPEITGKYQGKLPEFLLSQEGVDLKQRIEQLGGDAFLSARQMLKGGGTVTDYEGQKAEQALMRASRAQSPEALASALKDFRTHMARGLEMLEQQAGGNLTPQPSAAPAPAPTAGDGPQPGVTEDGFRFLGGDPADPNSWEKVQ